MWDERYQSEEYAYGIEPNDFLRESIHYLPNGKVLSLAEGEGRNAVFLARRGYEVTAVDSSSVGIAKAQNLADKHGVSIECIHADLGEYVIDTSTWNAIISIFCPIPSTIRRELHKKVINGLKEGGVFLVEAYTPAQVLNDTGGGKNKDVMQTKSSLTRELDGLHFEHLLECEREIIEGKFHTGKGSVVQSIATKRI